MDGGDWQLGVWFLAMGVRDWVGELAPVIGAGRWTLSGGERVNEGSEAGCTDGILCRVKPSYDQPSPTLTARPRRPVGSIQCDVDLDHSASEASDDKCTGPVSNWSESVSPGPFSIGN